MHHSHSSENRRSGDISVVAACVACWFWAGLALMSGLALLALLAINRAWDDGVEESLLFRLIAQAWFLVHALEATRLPGPNIDPRHLYHYANRDFDDAFLIGSAVIAFALAAAFLMIVSGLARGRRWALWSLLGMTSVAALVIAAYAVWGLSHGAPADVLAVIAFAAAVPAALAATLFHRAIRPDPFEPPPGGRRNPLMRPALLLLFSAHAVPIVPALACTCVVAGILVRQVWLAWTS